LPLNDRDHVARLKRALDRDHHTSAGVVAFIADGHRSDLALLDRFPFFPGPHDRLRPRAEPPTVKKFVIHKELHLDRVAVVAQLANKSIRPALKSTQGSPGCR
jgi:hypothetical protein